MPFCKKCGHGLAVDATVCENCGYVANENAVQNVNIVSANDNLTPPPAVPNEQNAGGAARRQNLIDKFYLRLKWELKAWSIAGKVCTIIGGICSGLFLIFLIAAIAFGVSGDPEIAPLFGMYAYFFFVYALILLPIGIVNLIMKGKVQKYMDGLYYDCGPAVKRGESVGMIIFNYLFNNVALVFYVINFITVKEHRSEFEEIRTLQLNANRNRDNT